MADRSGILPYSVAGKSAIVTGAGSGINFEYAMLLLREGCNVLVADLKLRPDSKEAFAQYATGSPRAVFLETDVTDWGQLARTFNVAIAEFGEVDIVTPGAGIFEPAFSSFWHPPGVPGSASRDPVDGFGHYATLDINVSHPIRMTQLAISWFLQPPPGRAPASPANPKRIIHIASIASEIAMLPVPLYIASKWAVSGFVRCLDSLELSHGIKVAAVAPGVVKTPIWLDAPDKMAFLNEGEDEWVTPQEVAAAMLKLSVDPSVPGGTVLEIGAGHTRDIPLYGNTGPQGRGHTVSNAAVAYGEVHRWLAEPGWGKSAPK